MSAASPNLVLTEEELENISKEFSRLKGKTFLDHAGASLCPETALKNIAKDQIENLHLNPHTSKQTTDQIDQIRYLVLNHLNADPEEYTLIFTSGSTASLKSVAETFDYGPEGAFVYLEDNHTSVLGMRELASSSEASVIDVSVEDMFDQITNFNSNDDRFQDSFDVHRRSLFVYPAQSNFNGRKYPLQWIDCVREYALNKFTEGKIGRSYSEWAVFLDAAAHLSTANLDLSQIKPDFCCLSFYKMFGYPTGLGALIVRNRSAKLLNKKYYGGGTVEIAMSRRNFHVKREFLHERFEDGTVSFLSILALKHCFDALNKIIPSQPKQHFMDRISNYTFHLAKTLYTRLKSLHHANGEPVIKLYADTDYNNIHDQGGIVNFNVLRANGQYYGFAEVVHMSELFNVLIRSGCFCNPGACQRHLKLTNDEVLKHFKAGHKCGDDNDLIDGVPTGSIRVSFGYMSTKEDIDTLMNMIVKCFVEGPPVYMDGASNVSSRKMLENTYKSSEKIIQKESLRHDGSEVDFKLDTFQFKGKLKEIHLYPIKSCGSFKVNSWKIGSKGLEYDREWMIITETGVALTQKHEIRMCLIKPSISLDDRTLTLSYPDTKYISIPIKVDSLNPYQRNICHSKVCGDKIQGFDCGDEVAAWLSDVLITPGLRLIKQNDEAYRISKKSSQENTSISLSNQAQYLMVNLASVKWLAGKVESHEFDDRIDNLTKRFRGNLIVETEKEFEEFSWQYLRIGRNFFRFDGPCTRCQMVCIDQETGDKTTEPLRTISKEFQGKLHFGAYTSFIKSDDNRNIICCNDDVFAAHS